MSELGGGGGSANSGSSENKRQPLPWTLGRDIGRRKYGVQRPELRWRRQQRQRLRAFVTVVKQQLQWFYSRLILEILLRRKVLAASKDGRHIPLHLAADLQNPHGPLVDERRGRPYTSNTIRTSRYTVWDFFPKQLLFQCSRLGNFYFLCVGIPQTIPGLSTTGNVTTILPLLFFILLTIAKEGYDDYKRHRLDNVENARLATVLRPLSESNGRAWNAWLLQLPFFSRWYKPTPKPKHAEAPACGYSWVMVKWKDIRVGDVLLLARDEDIPADIVLLHAEGENGLAYIETMALDGETNLKSKQASLALKGCNSIAAIVNCQADFVVEDPNPNLYRFEGRVTANGQTLPLTLNEVIYRGCTLRNTPSIIGLVINTGEECKMRRNANRHPTAKRPALERMTNKVVITLAIYVIFLSVGCSVGYLIWQKAYEDNAFYLAGAAVPFYQIIVAFAIQFNNVIPLALYVSLEIVKVGQMLLLNSDMAMYDEASDTPARCNTNTILENLGQVGYVFSDKTGTLTENIMKFRKLSVAGTSWLHEMDIRNAEDGASASVADTTDLASAAAPTITGASATSDPSPSVPKERERLKGREATTSAQPISVVRRSSSHWTSTGRPDHVQPKLSTEDLLDYVGREPHSAFSRRATQYILGMALCHTCLPEVREGHIAYQASSLDELALVQAAQELGFSVVQRSSERITLLLNDGTSLVYEILDIIEFTSKRKRMSILLRCPDGRIWLLSKGADSMLIPRLKTADLAIQKVNETRKSAELEHELHRRSEQQTPRNSFGGRPSLTIRRQAVGVNRRPIMDRGKSFEVGDIRQRQSQDDDKTPIISRTVSLKVPKASFEGSWAMSAQSSRQEHLFLSSPSNLTQKSLEKFAFLDDPAISDDSTIFTRCFKHLDEFASEGLRTLLFAHRFIPEQEYRSWKKLYDEAATSLDDREAKTETTGDLIEQNMDLLGASAIEDKLQAGVPETIDKLRKANIKIWMLTGDKRETAVNIAHSARICRPGSDVYILDAAKGDLEAQLLGLADDIQQQQANHSVVVIDGHTLAAIDAPNASFTLGDLFYGIIPHVDSVICCRASPAQKALLVRAIRKASSVITLQGSTPAAAVWRAISRPTPPLTLAIGDGANDLAMLAAAHVGVGISGQEGLQAARVADYSIAQFRFLARLLLIHGRYDYVRTADFILWTFWKEMFFYLPTILYQRYNGYTGTSLYESWSLTVLNTLFTSLCVVVPGIFEKDLAPETLLAVPELYVFGQRDGGLNVAKYLWWMLGALIEGFTVWFGCWAGYGAFTEAVADEGLFAIGDMAFTACIIWTNWKLLIIETHCKTLVVLVSCFITVGGWFAWNGFLSSVYGPGVNPYAVRNGFSTTFGRDVCWWASLGLILCVLMVVEIGYKAVRRAFVVRGWRLGSIWRRTSRFWGTLLPGRRKDTRELGRCIPLAENAGGGKDSCAGPGRGFRGTAEEWALELWQEMERDSEVKKLLQAMNGEEGGNQVIESTDSIS